MMVERVMVVTGMEGGGVVGGRLAAGVAGMAALAVEGIPAAGRLGVLAAGVDAVAGMAALVVEAEAGGADGVLMAPGEEGMLEDAGTGAGAGAGLDGEAEGGMASGVAGVLGGQSVMVLGTAVMIPGFADT